MITRHDRKLLLIGALLVIAIPAAAATQVSNLSESLNVEFTSQGTFAHASSFTTGSSAVLLQSITVSVFTNNTGTAELRLRADNAGSPGALIESLGSQTLPSNMGNVLRTFNSPGTPTLAANTTYWVTLGETGSGDLAWDGTTSTAQTSPSAWTIGDQMKRSSNGGVSWVDVNFGPPNESGKLAVDATSAANAVYYSVVSGACGGNACSGAQGQIGNGLPLPIQANQTGMGGPIATGTMFPPLLIPANPDPANRLVKQTGTGAPQMKVPPGVFRHVQASPKVIGVAKQNVGIFQVRTKLSFSAPAAIKGTMTFKKNGVRTGPVTFTGTPPGAFVIYSGSSNRFGGPSQTRIVALTKIGVWLKPGAMLPCKHPTFGGANGSCIAPLLPVYPMTLAAAGGAMTMAGKVTAGVIVTTPGGPAAMSPAVFAVSVPNTTGLIAKSVNVKNTGTLTNMATSIGFPWTTGKIKFLQPGALNVVEQFTITGKDSRTAMGAGTISLVSGALSNRKLTGPNANRSWSRYTLPEPAAAIGAAVALTMLGICHGLVRRR